MRYKKRDPFSLLPSEKSILKNISENPLLLSEVSRISNLPRTTTLHALKKLESRGLVLQMKAGKRSVWSKATIEKVEESFESLEKIVDLSFLNKSGQGVRVFNGIEELKLILWSELRALPKHGALTGVQTANSAHMQIEKLGTKEIAGINKFIEDKQFVVSAVFEEEYYLKNFKKFGTEWLGGFKERIAAMVFVPQEYLLFDAEMNIFVNKVLLINWKEETGILIEDKNIVKLLKSLFKFMHDRGRRLNHHEIAKILLETGVKRS
jgi:hypothetical protein